MGWGWYLNACLLPNPLESTSLHHPVHAGPPTPYPLPMNKHSPFSQYLVLYPRAFMHYCMRVDMLYTRRLSSALLCWVHTLFMAALK